MAFLTEWEAMVVMALAETITVSFLPKPVSAVVVLSATWWPVLLGVVCFVTDFICCCGVWFCPGSGSILSAEVRRRILPVLYILLSSWFVSQGRNSGLLRVQIFWSGTGGVIIKFNKDGVLGDVGVPSCVADMQAVRWPLWQWIPLLNGPALPKYPFLLHFSLFAIPESLFAPILQPSSIPLSRLFVFIYLASFTLLLLCSNCIRFFLRRTQEKCLVPDSLTKISSLLYSWSNKRWISPPKKKKTLPLADSLSNTQRMSTVATYYKKNISNVSEKPKYLILTWVALVRITVSK